MSSLEVKGSKEPAGQEARELTSWNPGRSTLHLRTNLSFQEPHLLQTQSAQSSSTTCVVPQMYEQTNSYLDKLIRCLNGWVCSSCQGRHDGVMGT